MLPDLLSVVLRGLSFVALLQAGGAALFVVLLGRELTVTRGAIIKLIRVAAPTGAALLVAQYLLQPARMTGALAGLWDAGLQEFQLHTRAPLVLAMRLGGLLLVWVALRHDGARLRSLALVSALLISASFAATGHTAQSPLWPLLGPLLVLHLLIAQFWFGSLVPLLWAAEREPTANAHRIVQRFSQLAAWSVPLIAIAGVGMAAVLLEDVAALRQPYGIGLLLKTLAFAVLMGLAALNKWRLGPALQHAGRAASVRLRRSIAAEYLVLAAVLMGTAALTTFWSPEI
jgi:putative copper export protein